MDWNEGREQFADIHEVVSEDGRSRGPSIDLDPAWDEITQLRWVAAIIENKTGIRIYVHHGRGSIDGVPIENEYSLNIGNSSLSSATFHDNWQILVGVEIGVDAYTGITE